MLLVIKENHNLVVLKVANKAFNVSESEWNLNLLNEPNLGVLIGPGLSA